MDVLQRHIDVAHDFGIAGQSGNEIVAPVGRMRVEQPHPEIAWDFGQRIQQTAQGGTTGGVHWLTRPGFFFPQIHAEVGGILADEIEFSHAFGDQLPSFLKDGLDSAAAVATAHLGDHTEAARMIAALGDFDIAGVGRGEAKARGVPIRQKARSPSHQVHRLARRFPI